MGRVEKDTQRDVKTCGLRLDKKYESRKGKQYVEVYIGCINSKVRFCLPAFQT